MAAEQLAVKPDVFDGKPDFFEQVEYEFEFGVVERFAGDVAVENGDADDGFPIQNGQGYLAAQEFKFPLGLGILPGFVTVPAQNPAQPRYLFGDAGFEGQFKVVQQFWNDADGAGGFEPTGFRRSGAAVHPVIRLAEKNGGTVDAEHFAQLEQKLFEHGLGIQRVREDGGKPALGSQVPVLGNLTEFGLTPLFTLDELRQAGVRLALYPLSAFRAMNKAAATVYDTVRAQGTQQSVVDLMQTRKELYDVLQYQTYEQKLDRLFAEKKTKGEL